MTHCKKGPITAPKALAILAIMGLAVSASSGTCRAAEITRSGPVVRLSGMLGYGAQHAFKEFVKTQPAGSIRVVDLDSNGGSVDAATDIARFIRDRGWSTQVDAARSRCLSACTMIFAAGVQRHYLNAGTVKDGPTAPREARGLGYHEASAPTSRQHQGYSGNGTAAVIDVYYEMGSAEAAKLVTQAPPGGLFVVSGATALSRGIATSLARP